MLVQEGWIEPGRAALAESGPLQEEELWHEDDGADHSGWFCVRTNPFPCPASACTFVAGFMTAAHLIVAAGGPVHGVRAS